MKALLCIHHIFSQDLAVTIYMQVTLVVTMPPLLLCYKAEEVGEGIKYQIVFKAHSKQRFECEKWISTRYKETRLFHFTANYKVHHFMKYVK